MKTKILITIPNPLPLLLFSVVIIKETRKHLPERGVSQNKINSQKTDSSMAKPIHLTKADF